MIGETRGNMNPEQSKLKVAIRDACVSGGFTLVSALLVQGYPPTPEALYMSGLTAFFTGLVSLMHALGIKKPQTPVPS